MSPHLAWYIARSGGIVGWFLCTASVLLGLALSSRALGRKPGGPWMLDLHRFVGGLSIVFVSIHVVALLLDPKQPFTLAEVAVPLVSRWKPGPVAFGVVGAWLLLAIEVTSLLKSRIPKRAWRAVHLTSFVLYAVATVHLLTAGTDRHAPILWGSALASVAAVAFLTAYRLLMPRAKRSTRIPARLTAVPDERSAA